MPYLKSQKETGESSWFSFSIIVHEDANITRHFLVKSLEEKGIITRPIVSGNFLKQPVMKYMNHNVYGETPNADLIHSNGFYIGNHGHDISQELGCFEALCKGCI